MMRLFLSFVLKCATGFRSAAAAINEIAGTVLPTEERGPSPNGGQSWLLRLGLYELTRPKELADDWIWIIDHTIQTGRFKVLIVIGVRCATWETKRHAEASPALTHQDMSVWHLEPVENSNGQKVFNQLQALSQCTGIVPCAVLNDCGGDLQNGVMEFCQEHRVMVPLHDICHATANALKHELDRNEMWKKFLVEASRAKNQTRQTRFAGLMPPELKHKARWLNVEPLMNWGVRAMHYLRKPFALPGVSWEADELEQKMGWLRSYQPLIETLTPIREALGIVLQYGRRHGYHRRAKQELAAALAKFSAMRDTPVARIVTEILQFVERETSQLRRGQRFPASSEVLESLIGKSKQLVGQQTKSGFTKMLLGLAACVSPLSDDAVTNALKTVPVRAVRDWVQSQLGASVSTT